MMCILLFSTSASKFDLASLGRALRPLGAKSMPLSRIRSSALDRDLSTEEMKLKS